jgi:hypothetical protein
MILGQFSSELLQVAISPPGDNCEQKHHRQLLNVDAELEHHAVLSVSSV